MQLSLHATRPTPHGASRLVQAMSSWSVKPRRALSRHCRGARTYGHTTRAIHDNEYNLSPPYNGHTTTAMHDIEYPLPLPPTPPPSLFASVDKKKHTHVTNLRKMPHLQALREKHRDIDGHSRRVDFQAQPHRFLDRVHVPLQLKFHGLFPPFVVPVPVRHREKV